jgi:hypothetical protein
MYALLLETDNIEARWEELGEDSGIEDIVADELLPWRADKESPAFFRGARKAAGIQVYYKHEKT